MNQPLRLWIRTSKGEMIHKFLHRVLSHKNDEIEILCRRPVYPITVSQRAMVRGYRFRLNGRRIKRMGWILIAISGALVAR